MSDDPSSSGTMAPAPDNATDATSLQLTRRSLLMKTSALLDVSLLPVLTACSGDSTDATAPSPAPTGPAADQADVSFQSVGTAARVDSRFAGLSYEKDKLAQQLFTGTNNALIQLFRLLGPGVLRIGARAVDRSSWNGVFSGLTPILPAQINALAAFVQTTEWQVIYVVNMARNTPADEAAYVAAHLGTSLLASEIDNEPDLYRRLNYRSVDWIYTDYLKEWRGLRDAMSAASPGVAFSGPATSFDVDPLRLNGTAPPATSGQTLGGVTIGNDGGWAPEPQAPLIASGGRLDVLVPPASAILLHSL